MNLFKTSFWSSISTVFKLISGLIITKIIAIVVGPSGVALLGNFTNLTSMFTSFANGGITSGVTKYIAEFDDEKEKSLVVSNAFKINLICSFFFGVIIIIFNRTLSQITFGSTNYSAVFIIFGLTVVFYGLNTTIAAVLNGFRYIKSLIITGMIGSALSVVLAIVITMRFGLFGAAINTMIAQVLIFLINVLFIRKLRLFSLKMLSIKLDRPLLLKLFKFGAMSIVSAVVVPVSLILIRNYITKHFSVDEAGFVSGVWTISNAYLMVITTTLSIYYLPTLSGIKDKIGLRKEVLKGYLFLVPIALIGGIGVFVCRDLIINLLYTPNFMPMKGYFTFQIIGDTFKIASWVLAFLMIAKAMTRWFIITEIIFSVSYFFIFFYSV